MECAVHSVAKGALGHLVYADTAENVTPPTITTETTPPAKAENTN